MRKLATAISAIAMGIGAQGAFGYSATAVVTVTIGGNGGGTADPSTSTLTPALASSDIAWTSNGTSTIVPFTDSTYFNTLGGYNSRSYYNPDFASAAQCTAGSSVLPSTASSIARRKYGCRYNTAGSSPTFAATPVVDAGPVAAAAGTLTATDTTLTGTLTITSTTDEPSGATTTFSGLGTRLSNSLGNGFNGYNYRSADGSPFGNYWQGITTAGTYAFNLTGTFTSTSWDITGGSVRFSDAGFGCQQGGLGNPVPDPAPAGGTLCAPSMVAGGQSKTGTNLSWGWDLDGDGTGTVNSEIEVRDAGGTTVLENLSGVLASLSISAGTLTTNSGEMRRALGSSGGGCVTHIRYDGTKISCGTLTAGKLVFSGTVTESAVIPVPAAVWLGGSALGLLGAMRRRKAGS
jgi:hypothetical protein